QCTVDSVHDNFLPIQVIFHFQWLLTNKQYILIVIYIFLKYGKYRNLTKILSINNFKCMSHLTMCDITPVNVSIMEEPSFEEMDDDEFECSECEFKCPTESEMIQHSAIHLNSGNTNDKHNQSISENGFTGCITAKDMPGTNDSGNSKLIVKSEPCSKEDNYTAEDYQQCEDWNVKIELEDQDVDQETTLYNSDNQITAYDGILCLPKTERMDLSEAKDSHYSNTDIFTKDGDLGSETIVKKSGPFSSQMLRPRILHGFEIEVDNTGIYIPNGWTRKLFKRTRLVQGKIRLDCFYFTELGKKIRGKKEAYDHLIKYPSA
ncbi:unnamed protein product, partial [Meganyctiphanes norvegica]